MAKKRKVKTRIDPKQAMKYLLSHEFKHPQTEAAEVLLSADKSSGLVEENATSMTNAEGKKILYIITDEQDQKENKEDSSWTISQ